jgi:DNA-directed RNA polymerase specialized sigma24 family protein
VAAGAVAPGPDPAAAAEPPGAEVLAALARLARRGAEGLRRAAVVYRHHVQGRPMEGVARSLGITARTARRDARRALEELREILEEE